MKRHGEKMTGAEMVVQALIDQGVKHIFGYPGGAVLPIYDEIIQQDKVHHILVRHEQGAGHAAEGYARSTGKPGVALVTSGPGATNMVTPLTDALMDSIPIVCITGQVPTHLIGNDAFQECDTVGITRPATKHNWLVRDVNELVADPPRGLLRRDPWPARPGARRHSQGRPVRDRHLYGPPNMRSRKTYQPRVEGRPAGHPSRGRADRQGEAADLLYRRRRHQFRAARLGAVARIRAHLTGYPITSTLMGLGAYPAPDPQWLGMLGMHGTYEANNAMHDCDVMVCDRRPLRRPHHRPHQRLLAGLAEDPHRHRPVLDQQERPRRHPDHRRRRPCARGDDRDLEGEASRSPTRRR